MIRRLDEAGAVLIGKAAMIELAGGMNYRYASASLTGAAKNPWNTEYWTCGSSSGSGAIVAGALAAALASQEEIHPFGNIHASPDFQRHLANVLTRKALKQAMKRAGTSQ